ncbi:alcohol dehydrogenase catalytic domain-containing protein [Streptomyces sp. p1417]|uniref:Alcohol dehydrogenase catalytic domain-containing protein n=1 Tax=Streptomyces typhae TaxID=2681492 RepID=A0A6L6X955_9ACTN|nr:zinc-dependent alcohol dehydrogenase family protein [Streptomyces typhae]MVO90372.1 alcohol dehydrogenase catalytic domain-containing protein [Streptomyces typhae]
MLAVVADSPGPLAGALVVRDVDAPTAPGPGEVVVRMLVSTVNPSDAVTVSGAYGSRTSFPMVPGFEGVGVIASAGPGVPAGAVGQRVLPLGAAGNWQQYKRLAHSWCVPVPDDLPDEVACFAYINPLTATLMVERFCRSGARNAVVTAATSAIAQHLAELLTDRGVKPVGVVRGTPGRAVADPTRWQTVVRTDEPGWRERLRAAAGPRGVDVAFDCVGGDVGGDVCALTADDGVFVHYGLLSGRPLPTTCASRQGGPRVELFRLRDTVQNGGDGTGRHLSRLFAPVFENLRRGRLRTTVATRVGLSELPRHLELPGSGRVGKILIEIEARG